MELTGYALRRGGAGLLGLALLLAAGCGDDDLIAYSAPVGINLQAKSGDVKSGVIAKEKGITTESGNPYGVFIKDARDNLGVDPGRIKVDTIELLLGAKSKGVTKLEEVFSGKAEVLFVMDKTNNSHPAGSFQDPKGGGAVAGTATFGSDGLNASDWDNLLAGSFKVVLRGDAAQGFDKASAEADLQVTFTFGAYK